MSTPNFELTEHLKKSIGEFSLKAYRIAKKISSKKSSIIIQYNKGNISIGEIRKGSFNELKYKKYPKLIETYELCLLDCKKLIDLNYKGNNLRSFNIFFNIKNKLIKICKNKIGRLGTDKCKLFNEYEIKI